MVFKLQLGVSVQAVCHPEKNDVKTGKKQQQDETDYDIALQDSARIQVLPVLRDHEKVQRDKNDRQDPENVPGLRKVFILDHFAHHMRGGIVRKRHDEPAHGVVGYPRPQAEPQFVLRPAGTNGDGRVQPAGQAVETGE